MANMCFSSSSELTPTTHHFCLPLYTWIPSKTTLLPPVSPFPSISHTAAGIMCSKHYFHQAISQFVVPHGLPCQIQVALDVKHGCQSPLYSLPHLSFPSTQPFPAWLSILLISYFQICTSPLSSS